MLEFKTEVHTDYSESGRLAIVRDAMRKLNDHDGLLVWFAGHGNDTGIYTNRTRCRRFVPFAALYEILGSEKYADKPKVRYGVQCFLPTPYPREALGANPTQNFDDPTPPTICILCKNPPHPPKVKLAPLARSTVHGDGRQSWLSTGVIVLKTKPANFLAPSILARRCSRFRRDCAQKSFRDFWYMRIQSAFFGSF